jgi:replication factor A2
MAVRISSFIPLYPTDKAQLSIIGQILQVSSQATNITFKIDDGTGVMEVKQWVDSDAAPESVRETPKEGEYIHVWGRLKDFNGKRHIGSHKIRPITDFNEINYHLLEATAVHLYFTRGPPETANLGGVKSEGGMFVDNGYGGGGLNGAATNGGKSLPAKLSAMGRKVYNLLNESPQNNEGLHVQEITRQLGAPINDVFKAGDELLQDGLIYTTIDDETWAVLE